MAAVGTDGSGLLPSVAPVGRHVIVLAEGGPLVLGYAVGQTDDGLSTFDKFQVLLELRLGRGVTQPLEEELVHLHLQDGLESRHLGPGLVGLLLKTLEGEGMTKFTNAEASISGSGDNSASQAVGQQLRKGAQKQQHQDSISVSSLAARARGTIIYIY